MIKDKLIQDNLENTATICEVEVKEAEKVIDTMYEFIRHSIVDIPMKDLSLEEFNKTKKNFNIPGLGKLYTTEGKFKRINKIE